jgi:AcrR family transcriptional regulator
MKTPLPASTPHHLPVQDRARRTEAAIVRAARALVARRAFSELTVPEIATKAGVSVGGFYRRFPSKEALAVFLAMEPIAHQPLASLREAIPAEEIPALSTPEILRRYYSVAARAFVENREVMRAAASVAREAPESALADYVRRFNADVHDYLRTIVLARSGEFAHPDLARAFDLGLLVMSAGLREIVLYGQPVSRLAINHLEDTIVQLANAHHAMLAPIAAPTTRPPRKQS